MRAKILGFLRYGLVITKTSLTKTNIPKGGLRSRCLANRSNVQLRRKSFVKNEAYMTDGLDSRENLFEICRPLVANDRYLVSQNNTNCGELSCENLCRVMRTSPRVGFSNSSSSENNRSKKC